MGALVEVQDDNFVLALPEPRPGKEQALLRTDAPVAAQVMSVHPNVAFAPAAQVEKHVAHRVELESAAVESRRGFLGGGEVQQGEIGKRQAVDSPAGQLLGVKHDALGDALAI